MEAPAAAAAAPTGPRNLTQPLAEWLRRMGFTVLVREGAWCDYVSAHWLTPDGHRFELEYTYARATTAQSTFQLHFYGASQSQPLTLVSDTTVRRLREARFLLLANQAYALHRATALAAGTLQPA